VTVEMSESVRRLKEVNGPRKEIFGKRYLRSAVALPRRGGLKKMKTSPAFVAEVDELDVHLGHEGKSRPPVERRHHIPIMIGIGMSTQSTSSRQSCLKQNSESRLAPSSGFVSSSCEKDQLESLIFLEEAIRLGMHLQGMRKLHPLWDLRQLHQNCQ